ncbi:hypothetical protein [Streptomyces hainanensis]|uniref:Uncharacterized protein n=1 Tax=Streptomyces hainanensis TaxID=402648 RepID=A0A4R4TIM1_9ACTN|nr:hypothetical protein [Streptomyces hainanensis]TDC77517.1 hypothetical protein E1283_07205 [Streptomyces hainanensis]
MFDWHIRGDGKQLSSACKFILPGFLRSQTGSLSIWDIRIGLPLVVVVVVVTSIPGLPIGGLLAGVLLTSPRWSTVRFLRVRRAK